MVIIQITGYKNSGKTTLIGRLIAHWRESGLQIGTVKHDAHSRELDSPGKDSWHHRQAGAARSVVVSERQTAWFEERALPLDDLMAGMRDLDVVLIEGFKHAPYPKILLAAEPADLGLADSLERVVAIARRYGGHDTELASYRGIPVVAADDPAGIARLLDDYLTKEAD